MIIVNHKIVYIRYIQYILLEHICQQENVEKPGQNEKIKKMKKVLAKFSFLLYTTKVIIIWLVGQAVKTSPSHGENRGSIPLRAALSIK